VFDGPPRPKPAPGEIVNNSGIHAGIRPQPAAAPISSLGDWLASKNLEAARKEMTACWEMLSREHIPEHDEREWFTLSQRLEMLLKRRAGRFAESLITRTKEDLADELESANRRIEHLEASLRRLDKDWKAAHDAIVRFITPERQRLTLAQAIEALGESDSAKAAKIKELERDLRQQANCSVQYCNQIERCQKMLTDQGVPNESSESSWLPLEERLASFIQRTSDEIALLKKANQAIDGAREKAETEAHALRQQLRQVRIAAGEEPKAS
jgi:hypothetical protein